MLPPLLRWIYRALANWIATIGLRDAYCVVVVESRASRPLNHTEIAARRLSAFSSSCTAALRMRFISFAPIAWVILVAVGNAASIIWQAPITQMFPLHVPPASGFARAAR